MEYQVKTLRLRQKIEEIENDDREFTAKLNEFTKKGFCLDSVILDERYSPSAEVEKVYLLIFKK